MSLYQVITTATSSILGMTVGMLSHLLSEIRLASQCRILQNCSFCDICPQLKNDIKNLEIGFPILCAMYN
uniref:Uncharacterized protein n=1 Tax=Arundo donax TaxID=35708 RepID=A0A0A9H270_ARUDO